MNYALITMSKLHIRLKATVVLQCKFSSPQHRKKNTSFGKNIGKNAKDFVAAWTQPPKAKHKLLLSDFG